MTDTASRQRGRPGTAAETRAKLVAAAMEVFLERGYDNTRVQDITDAAGYTTGALYAHFRSRMEILAEALLTEGERLVNDLATRMTTTDPGSGPGDGTVSFRIAEALTAPSRNVDRLILEAIAMATRDAEARAKIVPALTRVGERLTETAALASDRGVVDESTDPDAMSLLFLSIILGSTVIRALDLPRADPTDVAAILSRTGGTAN